MRVKNAVKFAIIIAIIAIVSFVMLQGITIGSFKIEPIKNSIRQGLDLKGGVYAIMEAQGNVTQDDISKAIVVINDRVNALGVTEPIIVPEGTNRIRVELPGVSDPESAINFLGQTAQLQFIGPDGKIVLTGADVKDSRAVLGKDEMGVETPQVTLSLTPDGAKKFADATEKYLNQQISIVLDDKVISAPVVRSKITGGEAVITGLENFDEASKLAIQIRSGALPVPLKPIEIRTVGPTLGQDALTKSIQAGIYGVLLVMLFMLAYYKLPGFVADIALVIYIIISFIVFAAIKVTMTLPGIAGVILSIGMAVDANVIIFERIKEELKNGKSLRASIDQGFSRALVTVVDSNVTTLIACAVLFFLGEGSIKGFAITLSIGVLASMLTAVVLMKYILNTVVGMNITKNPKLFGL
ncbi:protein translocase subunit SecD [Calorimonas adulescens]|uniref:Protein translocase subunit SecD n=1 Tax=Calorimonas adulescens TaxID=2606906 RepID=A0A5D8QG87_9THEO|nr:protein translocase subunit SecD [Calorimonas adulescens]TZE83511.1 protein translocase subunit SecD [Calorimonas adulescens]